MNRESLIVLYLCLLGLLQLAEESIDDWLSEYSESKDSTEAREKMQKLKVLLENIMEVEKHNEMFNEGKTPFKMKLNSFAEMAPSEFVNRRNGYRKIGSSRKSVDVEETPFMSPLHVNFSTIVDWRMIGAVTPIKDQKSCGSCWAFSAVGALEGQLFRHTRQLISLSEQNLIDCSSDYGNKGCSGGFMESAFQYIINSKGLESEKSYPYEAKDGTCRYNPNQKVASVKSFKVIQSGNETQLREAVALIGPIAAAMDASKLTFQFYSEGVYYEPSCSSTVLDHGVLITGYGTTNQGLDYWLVKNSYGQDWGESGYFKLARNRNNHCGIATSASFPML